MMIDRFQQVKTKKYLVFLMMNQEERLWKNFCGLRAKMWAYLKNRYNDDDYDNQDTKNRKAKGIKKFVIKRNIMLENYADYLFKILNHTTIATRI